jgi:hypothetical protein
MRALVLAVLATMSMHAQADSSFTKVEDTNGVVGEVLKIKVHHEFVVINPSSSTRNYLVAETCEVDGKKYKKGWGFSLGANGSKRFSEDQFLEYPATHTGEWKIEAMTSVGNSSAISWGYGKLRVK